MKTLYVFETITGHWLAGITSLDQVCEDSAEAAIDLWRQNNPRKRVAVEFQ